jgi:hypothetical protein
MACDSNELFWVDVVTRLIGYCEWKRETTVEVSSQMEEGEFVEIDDVRKRNRIAFWDDEWV